jgi:hypothetical protein
MSGEVQMQNPILLKNYIGEFFTEDENHKKHSK